MTRLILITALLASCQAQQSDQLSQPDPKQIPANEALAARNIHDAALGFVVVAWPGQGAIE